VVDLHCGKRGAAGCSLIANGAQFVHHASTTASKAMPSRLMSIRHVHFAPDNEGNAARRFGMNVSTGKVREKLANEGAMV
jgi:hypothetical protein